MLDFHPYAAAQVFDRIRETGFDGGYTIVKDCIAKIRPRKKPAYLTLSFAPGECAGRLGRVRLGPGGQNHPQAELFFYHGKFMVDNLKSAVLKRIIGKSPGIAGRKIGDSLKQALIEALKLH